MCPGLPRPAAHCLGSSGVSLPVLASKRAGLRIHDGIVAGEKAIFLIEQSFHAGRTARSGEAPAGVRGRRGCGDRTNFAAEPETISCLRTGRAARLRLPMI